MKRFSENLKRIREIEGYTQAEIAKKIGISPSSYNSYETGRDEIGDREPSFSNLLKLARILNVSTDELLGFSIDEFTRCEIMWASANYEVNVIDNEQVQVKKNPPSDIITGLLKSLNLSNNEKEQKNKTEILMKKTEGIIVTFQSKSDFITFTHEIERASQLEIFPIRKTKIDNVFLYKALEESIATVET